VNLRLLEPLGVREKAPLEPFFYSDFRKSRFMDRWGKVFASGSKPRIVIHPSAGYPSKKWPGEKFRELIHKITDENLGEVVLIGTQSEKRDLPDFSPTPESLVDLRGRTDLSDLPILFDVCDFFVGNDSGPAHLAAAQGMEILVLFSGTNDARLWRPWTERLHLMNHPVPCSPCEAPVCPLLHHDCMRQMTVEEVFEELKTMVNHSKKMVRKSS